jgi:hypothetical protein
VYVRLRRGAGQSCLEWNSRLLGRMATLLCLDLPSLYHLNNSAGWRKCRSHQNNGDIGCSVHDSNALQRASLLITGSLDFDGVLASYVHMSNG